MQTLQHRSGSGSIGRAQGAVGRLRRARAGARVCERCAGTGRLWVVCPDAGAVDLPCPCESARREELTGTIVQFGFGAVVLGACGIVYLLV